jgi:hypothetical protein
VSVSERAPAGIVLRRQLRRLRDLNMVEAPVEILAGRTATKARARVAGIRYLAYVFRLPGVAAVVVPPEVCAAAGVGAGDTVELWVDAVRLERPGSLPPDVAATLAGTRADIGVLSRQEQRQSLALIKEASNLGVRRARIDALVAACAAGQARRPLPQRLPP